MWHRSSSSTIVPYALILECTIFSHLGVDTTGVVPSNQQAPMSKATFGKGNAPRQCQQIQLKEARQTMSFISTGKEFRIHSASYQQQNLHRQMYHNTPTDDGFANRDRYRYARADSVPEHE